MTSPVTYLAVQGLLEAPDWTSLGLVSAIIGCFLIANAILFEHPRRLVQQYFGRKTGRWKSVREHFAASPPVFEGDPAMVRELGELFSIEPEANDTVESYAARVRAKVGIPERGGAHRLIPRPVRMNYDDQIEEAI